MAARRSRRAARQERRRVASRSATDRTGRALKAQKSVARRSTNLYLRKLEDFFTTSQITALLTVAADILT